MSDASTACPLGVLGFGLECTSRNSSPRATRADGRRSDLYATSSTRTISSDQ